jgi:hypothetical protein
MRVPLRLAVGCTRSFRKNLIAESARPAPRLASRRSSIWLHILPLLFDAIVMRSIAPAMPAFCAHVAS